MDGDGNGDGVMAQPRGSAGRSAAAHHLSTWTFRLDATRCSDLVMSLGILLGTDIPILCNVR